MGATLAETVPDLGYSRVPALPVVRPVVRPVVLMVVLAGLVVGCSAPRPATTGLAPSGVASSSAPTASPRTLAAAPTTTPTSPTPTSTMPTSTRPTSTRPTSTMPTSTPRAAGRLTRVHFQVEKGLAVDRAGFADFVLKTLNDERSWARDDRRFVRTDGAHDVRVVLASPATSAAMCRPLVTYGKLSCARGRTVVLTMYRWVRGTPDYAGNLTGYRRYLVNHEVGHTLGHGHQSCPGTGRRAPVMMQQTKGLDGCRPNSWPYP